MESFPSRRKPHTGRPRPTTRPPLPFHAAEPAAAPEEPAADAPPAEEALPDLLDVSPAPEEETYFVPDTQEMDLPLTPPPPAAPAAPASREEEEPPAAAAPAPLPEEPTKSETD